MKVSTLRKIIKECIYERVTEKNINSVHPTAVGLNSLKNMTLSNLKALREKSARAIKFIIINKKSKIGNDDNEILDYQYKLFNLYDTEIKKRLKYINKPVLIKKEDHGLGYSHNSSFDNIKGARDPLNDPLLTGKSLNENNNNPTPTYEDDKYKYVVYKFRNERTIIDVYYNTIYLGELTDEEDSGIFMIEAVNTLNNSIRSVSKTDLNKYYNMKSAAEDLHSLWGYLRRNRDV